jgi:uncharacterized protein YjbI with pentapeptide repeats
MISKHFSRVAHIPALTLAIGAALYSGFASAADWEGYERMDRSSTEQRLQQGKAPLDLSAHNFSNVDLNKVDFKAANLSASVFNGANLHEAKLDGVNLTVAFLEHANLSGASFRKAEMFSVQVSGADLRGADLADARVIGDLRNTNLTGAHLERLRGAADMKNQSMGLMRTDLSHWS